MILLLRIAPLDTQSKVCVSVEKIKYERENHYEEVIRRVKYSRTMLKEIVKSQIIFIYVRLKGKLDDLVTSEIVASTMQTEINYLSK